MLLGTLYKDMQKRVSILEEFVAYNGILGGAADQDGSSIASEDDILALEDESGRIKLVGNLIDAFKGGLVTGIVVALKGSVINGEFDVQDLYYYGDALSTMPTTYNNNLSADNSQPCYVMLVSGLEVGAVLDENDPFTLSHQMLVDFIAGRLSSDGEKKIAKNICRVIIAGNSISSSSANADVTESVAPMNKSLLHSKIQNETSAPMKHFDTIISQALGSCPIDIMPGISDPAVRLMPQQPFHPCLFSHGVRFSTLKLCTNPYEISINNKLILGHSGQPVFDINRQVIRGGNSSSDSMDIVSDNDKCNNTSELSVLESTLSWGNICPTAPDTLPCYPFTQEDLFILRAGELPNIYFSGNCTKFATKLFAPKTLNSSTPSNQVTRLICVPSFKSTGQVVLCDVNSKDFQCFTISFSNVL